ATPTPRKTVFSFVRSLLISFFFIIVVLWLLIFVIDLKLQNPGSSKRRENDASTKVKRTYRRKPGTVALREIRNFQKSFNCLIPTAPFVRTVREITHQFSLEVSRWQAEALIAIQEV
ncbi:histone H3-like centromeric protein HTR12, partial [Bienertia sinuspersici]